LRRHALQREIIQLRRLAALDCCASEISRHLDRPACFVRYWARKLGVNLRRGHFGGSYHTPAPDAAYAARLRLQATMDRLRPPAT